MSLLFSLALLSQAPVDPQALLRPSDEHDATIGEPRFVRIERQDDSIPLPVPALYAGAEEGNGEGDRLIAPASGDPFFLGFVAGKHYPPEGERIDPDLTQIIAGMPLDGRPARRTYAFVMFSKRMTTERVEALEALGAKLIEFHPFYTLKVSFDPARLEQLAGLDFVRWVGAVKTWQKFHPDLSARLAQAQPGESLDVYVNVFESDLCADSERVVVARAIECDPDGNVRPGNPEADAVVTRSNGWQHKQLAALGVEVGPWVESIRAFHASVPRERFEELAGLDFVQFVDLDLEPGYDHDEGMPMANADRTRASYPGTLAQAGVIDSGMHAPHIALTPWAVGWDYTGNNNPFADSDGHGTHVTGTILGNGNVDDSYKGGAPSLGSTTSRRFFIVRRGSGAPLSTWLSRMNSSYFDGTNISPAPMVVSNSYSANVSTSAFIGSESAPRTIDANAFSNDQLWIWSASNEGPTAGTIGLESCAKNAITVGNVLDYRVTTVGDPGTIWTGSSRGPCGDGRWKPNISAVGQQLYSCQTGTTTGYAWGGGTSMSTPLVSSVAAQLADHYSFLRYNPAALSAVLMAGGLTKDNVLLTSPTGAASHLNAYGTGRLDAYRAHWGTSQQALSFWSFSQTWPASTVELDFTVSSGATRLAVVYHYKEVAASAGASQALVSDMDMYLDVAPFTSGGNTGEYFSQRSGVDNTEVRILNNPAAANWRVKIYPEAQIPFTTVRGGVCVIVSYGAINPTPTLNVSANKTYAAPNEDVIVTASYTNPSHFASSVFFDSTSTGDSLQASYNMLADGATADLMGNWTSGRDVAMGNVAHQSSRTHNWRTRWSTQGIKTFSVQARSDTAVNVTDTVTVYVDSSPPPLPTNLQCSTHAVNVWSNNPSPSFSWSQAADNVSGLAGYGRTYTSSPSLPGTTLNLGAVTSTSTTLGNGAWYLNLRPRDNAGNWNGSSASFGPIRIDTTAPGQASGLSSSTHQLGVQSCNTNVTINFTPATDTGGSGLAGYAVAWSAIGPFIPTGSLVVPPGATSYTLDIGSAVFPRYFNLRARDNAGNWGTTVSIGPFDINANSVATYCTGKTNSLGCVPAIASNGVQPSKSAGNFTVTCSNVISQKNGLLFFGFGQIAAPFQGGTMCVSSPTLRTASQNSGGSAAGNDCSGSYGYTFSTAEMNAFGLVPGQLVYCQYWMRDPQSPSTTGLSNALRFTVCQ